MQRILINPMTPDIATVELAAKLLSRGEMVVGPTETRYGLMARADDPSVLEQLFKAKGRPETAPTALFAVDYAAVNKIAVTNDWSDRLAARFLPGPLTLVLLAKQDMPPQLAPVGKVGLRISSSPFVSTLLERIDFPVTATSANMSGRGGAEAVDEICRNFGDAVALVLDAGPLTGPVSTVVDCSGNEPALLREGAISKDLVHSIAMGVE